MILDTSMLPADRAPIYSRIASKIGTTPLVRLAEIEVPNGCEIFLKCEYLNPTGSLYDRMTLALLAGLEGASKDKRLIPGAKLAETTTGSSGASFAWLCRVLGYQALVFIPADMPAARIAQIRSYGAEVRLTPAGEYIEGLVQGFEEWNKTPERAEYRIPNHSLDTTWAPSAMGELAQECVSQLVSEYGIPAFDYFVAALGNGTSARGMHDGLPPTTRMIGVSPAEWPHCVFGTGAGNAEVNFPNLEAVSGSLGLHELVEEAEWRPVLEALQDQEVLHVGHSTALCVTAALRAARSAEQGSRFLVLAYDASWRYLELAGVG